MGRGGILPEEKNLLTDAGETYRNFLERIRNSG